MQEITQKFNDRLPLMLISSCIDNITPSIRLGRRSCLIRMAERVLDYQQVEIGEILNVNLIIDGRINLMVVHGITSECFAG